MTKSQPSTNTTAFRLVRHAPRFARRALPVLAFAVCCALTASAVGVSRFVEYIESDGSGNTPGECILLDYTPTSNSVVEAEVAIRNLSANHTIFCSRANASSRLFTCFYVKNEGFRWDYDSTQNKSGKKPAVDERHTIRCSRDGFEYDGVMAKTTTPADFVPGNQMTLFASYNNQAAPTTPTPGDNYAKMRLYSFKAWDDGGATLKVDLRPYVDENGNPALFDCVTERTYTNIVAGKHFLASAAKVTPPPQYADLAVALGHTNGVWYATADLLQGAGDVELLVISPDGATNVVAMSDAPASAPASFTVAIPGLADDTEYFVRARTRDGLSFSTGDFFLNGDVTIEATPDATSASPGAFTVRRPTTAGATGFPLTVAVNLSGTAVAGMHYAHLPATVTIPAGAASATVAVTALRKETTTTSLALALSDGNYFVGDPSSATMAISTTLARTVVYVAPAGTGDGSSWASPMGSLANAYAAAAAFVEGGGASAEVWVKAGRYTISSYIVPKSHVAVLGGFLGTETDASQARRENLTILSGDKNNDDYWMPCGTNTAEKLYVWTGEGRMTFNPPAPRDADEYWQLSNGGAGNYGCCFQTVAGNPPVTNCTFAGLTFTSFATCPVYMYAAGPHVGVTATNCNFWACSDNGSSAFRVTGTDVRVSDNLCWGGRSGIFITSPASVPCTNEVSDCIFRDIYVWGGLYLQSGTTHNTWRVKRCGFVRNRSDSNGYAPVVNVAGNMSVTRFEMTDCYVRECILTGSCYGLVQTADGGMSHTLLFKDCDFEGNIRTNSTSGTACFTGCKIGKNWYFDGCSFRGNRIWYAGSGCSASVYYAAGANQYATFLNCSMESNSVEVINGAAAKMVGTVGLFSEHTRISLINSLLDGNTFSGAATNAEVCTSVSYNMLLAIVNSVLHGDAPGYAPLRVKVSPYLYKSWLSNFDKNAVGCASWSRCADVSTDGAPGISGKLRHKAGRPHQIRGLWHDSPFWRVGTDIWIRYRPTGYPRVYLRNSGKTPWYPINYGAGNDGESSQSDATMASWGITVDSPLVPDALGNRRKAGKVAYGPIGYAAPAVMAVR